MSDSPGLLVTEEWLKQFNPCEPGYLFYREKGEQNPGKILALAISEKRYKIAVWLLHKLSDNKIEFVRRYHEIVGGASGEDAALKFLRSTMKMGEVE